MAIAEYGINGTKCKCNSRKRDSLEGSDYTPMYDQITQINQITLYLLGAAEKEKNRCELIF